MNRQTVLSQLAGALLIIVLAWGCTGTDPAGPDGASLASIAEKSSGTPLSPEEIADLIYIREEEKVARDVYTVMYDLWGENVFFTISGSEQKHMDAILALLDHYSIQDPVGTNGIGEFFNDDLGDMYKELVDKGTISLQDALQVGVLIEVTDIDDLESALGRTDLKNVEMVYTHLRDGSENHLASFTKLLEKY